MALRFWKWIRSNPVRYTVSGNGVANRSARNYLDDPKVQQDLKKHEHLRTRDQVPFD